MTKARPDREWWTAEALAASGLPDMPQTRQGVDLLAKRHDWRAHPELARRRQARGGGWEYHWRLLPARTQAALLREVAPAGPGPRERMDRGEAWAWFDGLPEAVKAKARARLVLVRQVRTLEPVLGRAGAIEAVCRDADVAARTVWSWLALVEGVDHADELAYLAPRHRSGTARREHATCSQEFIDRLKADYLRLGGPSLRSAHRRVVDWCKAQGLGWLEYQTARRGLQQNVPHVTQVFAREGEKGLARCFPPQIRDRSGLTALEGVVADCHKLDVFVQWPEIEKPVRVQIVAFTDLYSNKVLSWKVDLDPNKVAVAAAWGELVETWGIPRHCLFDNGREFANKWLTGGTPTRFRFKVREDDVLGILPQMGVTVHWATPAHGQAKPVERTFGDFARDIALHPAFAGAYGKTSAAVWNAQEFHCCWVEMKASWSLKKFVSAVMSAVFGARPPMARTIGDMVDLIGEELGKSGRPLLIDEADLLAKSSYIAVVRDIYEIARGPVILIGEENMPQTLRRWERVHNRMLDWVPAQPADLREVGLLAGLKCPDLKIAPEVLQTVLERSHGRARRIVVNLRQISEFALRTGKTEIGAEEARKIVFFTGDAPAPRMVV